MSLSHADLMFLVDHARQAARIAGDHIAGARPGSVEHKDSGSTPASQVVTEVDRAAEALILDSLSPAIARFDLGILSEERPDDGQRLTKDHFWSIDPLDGTLAFVEGTPGYAVSIALVSRAGVPMVASLFDPVDGTSYSAVKGLGLWRDAQPWLPASAPARTLSVYLDRSAAKRADYPQLVAGLNGVAAEMGLDTAAVKVRAGAVMNACQALRNPPGCYFKFPKPEAGGGSLWDFAATACLFAEAGAVATDIHGAALDLNRADDTFMNHRGVLFATDTDIAERLRKVYRDLRAQADAPE